MRGNRENYQSLQPKKDIHLPSPLVFHQPTTPQGPALHARCTLQRASLASWERRYDAVELAVGDHNRLAGWLGGGLGEISWLIFLQKSCFLCVYIYICTTRYIYIHLVAPEESWVGFLIPKIFSKPIDDFLLIEIGGVFFCVNVSTTHHSFFTFTERFYTLRDISQKPFAML